jgi:hypothetical protein
VNYGADLRVREGGELEPNHLVMAKKSARKKPKTTSVALPESLHEAG